MRVLKKKTKTRTVIFAVTVTALMGVCLTLVIEDAAQVPTSLNGKIEIDPNLFKDFLLSDWTYNTIRDFLLEHPDWAEAIATYIIENFDLTDLLQHLTIEELQQLCEMFPGLEEVLGPILLGMLGELGDGSPSIEPSMSLPELVAAAFGAVDNGMLGEDDPAIPLFDVESTYKGTTYIRSVSLGDYNPTTRRFSESPKFDGTGYVLAPSLFPSAAVRGDEPYTLTFHMNGHRDFGTLVGDVSASTYIDDNEAHKFDPDSDSRVWLIDADDYRVSFYPEFDYEHASIDDTYVFRNERKYRKFVQENYLSVASNQQSMLQDFISAHNLTSPEQAAEYLSTNYTYAFKAMDCPVGLDIVHYFLNVKKAGTCTNFASALTLLSRQMGVPARFVQGYLGNLSTSGYNSITSKELHAWTEVYVEGVGWKRLDATPAQRIPESDPTQTPDGKVSSADPESKKSEKALMTVSSVGPYSSDVYLRNVSFGDYNASTNSFAMLDEEDLPDVSSAKFNSRYTSGTGRYMNIEYEDDFMPYGMLTANYSSFTYDEGTISMSSQYAGKTEFTAIGDARFARQASTYVQRYYNSVNYSVARTDDSAYLPFLNKTYPLTVPSSLSPTINSYISMSGVNSPEQVEESLRTKHVRSLSDRGNIANLLTGDHSGSNQTFAAAMVMLCRKLGYHARYVEGYRIKNLSGETAVTDSNRYYWVEVYYQGFGWKRFDPTPEVETADPTLSVKLQLKSYEIEYDGMPHLPSLSNIHVTCTSSPTYTGSWEGFAKRYLRSCDRAVITFPPSAGEGFTEPGYYRIRARFMILDAWGHDVTHLYTRLNLDEFSTDCILTITYSGSSEG